MKAVILAAGKGTRLGNLTSQCPKPMLPLHGKPLLQYNLDLLSAHGFRSVAMNLYHLPEVFFDYLDKMNKHGLEVTLAIEPFLLGSAGAIKNLEKFLDDTFVVIYGDLLTNLNLSALVDRHRKAKGLATLAVYQVEDPRSFGIVNIEQDGRITHFVEKPGNGKVSSPWANAGVYVMEPEILGYIPPRKEYDFGQDLFPALLSRGIAMYAHPFSEYLIDIGSPQNYKQAQRDLEEGRCILC
jgi:mannose-1-phosphate guanylyltransferase/phosphomannomutase